MNRSAWVLATVLTVLLTGFVLGQVKSAVANRAQRFGPRRVELHGHARVADAWNSDAAARWRHCQATHWRACLLQR
ncbi:MAG TPA: hypothetical protein VG013_30745 [Gemmataceae bacterium]|jgi:hypothetical protein|nr:hypothetical protein [Gemmataceae bacterium]